jgi:4-hydroxybenzoate polyprenyltransferase
MKGRAKLQAIQQQVGQRFSYAGDSGADVEIWKQSASAVIIGSPRGSDTIRRSVPIEREFPDAPAGFLVWLRAMRAHQWVKNLLLFVPLLTSFAFLDYVKTFAAILAFLSFCLAASATYLINDLWDLENDRLHHRKKQRPLASARISIPTALAVAMVLLTTALAIAWFVGSRLLLTLVAYLVLTSAYSWTLKKVMLIDVLVLASLYTLRILAGSFAIGVHTSSWLLVFSIFMFFSLALVKRCSELVAIGRTAQTSARGRNYRVSDLAVLWPMGIGAGLCSVIVFAMFISTIESARNYESPHLMWLVVVGLVYWISRLWIKTARGEMHDDPLVFAIKDFGSRFTVAAMIAVTVVAHFFELNP